jgi:hypothetical protein
VSTFEHVGGAPASESEALALLERARAHSQSGRSEESRATVAELVSRYEHDANPAIRRTVCRALFGQAKHKLLEGVDRRAVIVDYRHVLHIAERPPPVHDVAAAAIYHLGLTHGKIAIERSSDEHREKSVERFLEAEQRFGSSREPETAYWVTRAVTSHALTLPLAAAAPLYERVIERYAAESATALRAHAVHALERWAERCTEAGQASLATALLGRAREISQTSPPT